MKVLVTGAHGFIGQHLVKALKEAGHDVLTLDLPWYASMDLAMDITQPLPKIPDLDAVIHLAAMAHPRKCDEDPGGAFATNVHGTSNVLRMALESGAKKFVFPSSAHVYDLPPKYLPSDEIQLLRLNNVYTTTKILGEQLCDLYWTNHGLSYTVLRLFNVYGPGQARGYFIPDMLARANAGSIELPGGNTTKDWVYVEDVAQAFIKALDTSYVGSINIGTGIETEISVLAEHIARATGAKFSSTPSPNATRMQADFSRARNILKWQPTIGVTEGIDRILQAEGISEPISSLMPVMDWK